MVCRSPRLLWLLLLLLIAGCTESGPQRVAVSGTVAVDGEPLERGSITFIGTEHAAGPKASGEIVDGRFAIDEQAGPLVGRLRIQIRDALQSDFALDDPDAFSEHVPTGVLPKQRVPDRYNTSSTLVRETTLEGPNRFEFELRVAR